MTTSSPGPHSASTADAMASVAPVVISTWSGSTSRPQNRFWCSATAVRSDGTPRPGGYWLTPPVTFAATSASSEAGPSVSGKPWPRLIAPVRRASADISAKIVDVNGAIRATSMARTVTRSVVVVTTGTSPGPQALHRGSTCLMHIISERHFVTATLAAGRDRRRRHRPGGGGCGWSSSSAR